MSQDQVLHKFGREASLAQSTIELDLAWDDIIKPVLKELDEKTLDTANRIYVVKAFSIRSAA